MSALDKWEQSHNLDEFTDFQIVEMLDAASAELAQLRAELDKKDETISQLKTACKNWEIRYATLNELVDKRDIQLAEKDAALEQMMQYFKQINDALYPHPHTISQIEFGDICDKVDAAWLSAHPAQQEWYEKHLASQAQSDLEMRIADDKAGEDA